MNVASAFCSGMRHKGSATYEPHGLACEPQTYVHTYGYEPQGFVYKPQGLGYDTYTGDGL